MHVFSPNSRYWCLNYPGKLFTSKFMVKITYNLTLQYYRRSTYVLNILTFNFPDFLSPYSQLLCYLPCSFIDFTHSILLVYLEPESRSIHDKWYLRSTYQIAFTSRYWKLQYFHMEMNVRKEYLNNTATFKKGLLCIAYQKINDIDSCF